VSSGDNMLADRCSKKIFHKDTAEQFPSGFRMLKVKPKCRNVMKFM